jgi:hypothetical protein
LTGHRACARFAAVVLILALPALAEAQVFLGGAKPRPGSVEVSGGGNWTGGQTFALVPASLTPNPSGGLSSFDQFTSEPSIDAAFGVHGNVGVYITRALAIEGGLQFSRPQMSVRLFDDVEDAPDVTATATMTSYVFRGSLIYHFSSSGRMVPFVGVGAGYVRDVHAGNELIESGVAYHGLAGVKMCLDARRRTGVRLEGGLVLREGSLGDDDRRMVPTAAVSLLYLY